MNKNIKVFIISIILIITFYLCSCESYKNEYVIFKNRTDIYNIEWGDKIEFEDFFSIKDTVDEYKINCNYDEHKVGEIQKLSFTIFINKKEYKKSYDILIQDTKPPIIEYTGELEIKQFSNFSLKNYLDVYDMMDEKKMYMPCEDILYNDKRSYTISVNNGKISTSMFDTSMVGIYEVTIGAADGHGNYTTKNLTIEVVNAN